MIPLASAGGIILLTPSPSQFSAYPRLSSSGDRQVNILLRVHGLPDDIQGRDPGDCCQCVVREHVSRPCPSMICDVSRSRMSYHNKHNRF